MQRMQSTTNPTNRNISATPNLIIELVKSSSSSMYGKLWIATLDSVMLELCDWSGACEDACLFTSEYIWMLINSASNTLET